MQRFTALYMALDATTKTNEKIAAMVDYFAAAPAADAAWAVYFLSGRRPKRLIQARVLRELAAEQMGLPEWLLVESYGAVGDSAETAVLLLPPATAASDLPLHHWIEARILPLRSQDEPTQRAAILQAWSELSDAQRFVFNKLITGGFRVGVSQRLLTRALAQVSSIDSAVIAHRLMGHWRPSPRFYQRLVSPNTADADISRPYPFFLAYPLEEQPTALGDAAAWQAEWKWDGIRAQLVRREGETFLWTRGEELVTERYPEVAQAAETLPDGVVLDGELLAWDGGVLPFTQLQRRIGRKTVGKKVLREVPVILLAYDLLEWGGEDWRERPLHQRRTQLEALIDTAQHPHLLLSEIVDFTSWAKLKQRHQESRERLVEGFMLKRKSSTYQVGRRRGDWWKWKVTPYSVDAVLIYAQRGSGRRASLYTDYTFAVWDVSGELVPFAKAYSGLTDAEIRQVDSFVRQNTRERFGPVRSVTPQLVFEIAFENIQRSRRHKSGVAVRFPRIVRWRRDKPIEEADTLEMIQALLPNTSGGRE